jgi:CheY-like chemotaxis protein
MTADTVAPAMAFRLSGLVLIVEDNGDTRNVLERVLGITGYSSISVENGWAALEYLHDATKPKPAVMVLDLGLPGVQGREVVAAMKADPGLERIPVVVFTADHDAVSGVAACVRKGKDSPDVLLDAIAACVTH